MNRAHQLRVIGTRHLAAAMIVGLIVALVPTAAWAAPPANDNFASPTVITGGTGTLLSQTTNEATFEIGEPSHGNGWGWSHSVWYSWTAPETRTVSITATPAIADSNGISVYTGNAVDGLTTIAFDGQFAGQPGASVIFGAQAGTTYKIAVGDNNIPGDFTLSWATPGNDAFATARDLTGFSGNLVDNNTGATKEAGEPNHAGNAGGASLWYSWRAPISGNVTITTVGSSIDTTLHVYTGSDVASLTPVAGDNNGGGGTASAINMATTTGTVYKIAVDGFNPGGGPAAGALELHYKQIPPPAPSNDDLADAEVISGISGNVTGQNFQATAEAGEPAHQSVASHSAWYLWTAPNSGWAQINLSPNFSGGIVAVYTGDAFANLVRVPRVYLTDTNTGQTSRFNAVGGTTYRIAVDGQSNATGPYTLNWRNQLNDPRSGGTIRALNPTASGSIEQSNAGATKDAGEQNHAGNPGGASIWFSWFSGPTPSPVAFNTFGSDIDTLLAVYPASPFNPTPVANNDDAPGSSQSRVTFTPAPNTPYFIAVDGFGGATGRTQINWLGNSNDNFANATTMPFNILGINPTFTGTVAEENGIATKEVGEPNHAGDAGGKSVWFKFNLPMQSRIGLDTIGSNFDTTLALYQGASVDTLTQLAADDDSGGGGASRLSHVLVAPGTYYVAIDGKAGVSGRYILNWRMPQNNHFADAHTISGSSITTQDAVGNATREPGEPSHDSFLSSNRTVWYRWVAPQTGRVRIRTTAGTAALNAYQGDDVSHLTSVIDQRLNFNNKVFTAIAGEEYFIVLEGSSTVNTWVLSMLDNDPRSVSATAGGPQVVSGPQGSVVGGNVGATLDATEQDHFPPGLAQKTVWYRWTAPFWGYTSFDTIGSGFDTMLAVYQSSPGAATALAKDDDSGGSGTSRVEFFANSGTTYFIAVAGKSGAEGQFNLNWKLPFHDNFARAMTLTENSGGLNMDSHFASKEVGEPNHAGQPGGHSVWFNWTAPYAGTAVFDTMHASDYDSVIGVYRGSSLGSLQEVASNDDNGGVRNSRVEFPIIAGRTYRIALDSVDPTGGYAWFRWNSTPADTTMPWPFATSGPVGTINSRNATWMFDSTEPNSTFVCSLDGAAYESCESPRTYFSLDEGDHTFRIKATDASGNANPFPVSYSWTIDLTPPDTSITSGPSGTVASDDATFDYSATGAPGGTFVCRLDSGSWAACDASGIEFTDLAPGSHTFQVAAVDLAGNEDPSPAERTWTIGNVTPPNTTIVNQPPPATNSQAASFTFNSSLAGSTFECSLDGEVYQGCESPRSFFSLDEGDHLFKVRAVMGGLIDATPAEVAWTIDRSAPATSITSGPSGLVDEDSAGFTYSSTEVGSFSCRLDDGPWESCPNAGLALSDLAQGEHTFSVVAEDAVGNEDPTPATRSWTVDTVGPTVEVTAPTAPFTLARVIPVPWVATDAHDVSSSDVFVRSGTFDADLGLPVIFENDVTTTEVTFSGVVLGATHCFTVTAVDELGNASAASAPRCTAVPLDDRSLARSGRWALRTGAGFFENTYLQSSTKGAALTKTGVRAERLALVVTKCPTCGQIQPMWNGVALGPKINLASPTTKKKQLVLLNLPSLQTGTFKVKVTTTGKLVQFDGLGVYKDP